MTPTAVTRPVAVPAAAESARGRTPGTGQGEAFAELLAATAAAVPVEDRPASRPAPARDQVGPGSTDVGEPGAGVAADPDAPVEEPAADRAGVADAQTVDAPAPVAGQPVPVAVVPGAVAEASAGEAPAPVTATTAPTTAAPVAAGTVGAPASAPVVTGQVTVAETPLAAVAGPVVLSPEDSGAPGGVAAGSAVTSEEASSPTPGAVPQGASSDAAPAQVALSVTGSSTEPAEATRPGASTGTQPAPAVPAGEAQPTPSTQPPGQVVAGPAAQATTTAATTADPVAGQVFPEVTRMLTRGDGSHRLVLKLAPEALGEVRVVLTVRQGEVHVRLAGGDAARAALAQGAPELHRLLEAAGATSTQISVGDNTTTGRDDRSTAHDGQQWDGRRHTDHRDARTRPGDTSARDGATTGMLLRPADPGTRTGSGVDVTM